MIHMLQLKVLKAVQNASVITMNDLTFDPFCMISL